MILPLHHSRARPGAELDSHSEVINSAFVEKSMTSFDLETHP